MPFTNGLIRMLNQTLNYLDHFARFTQKENVEAVERLLSAHKDLAKFERAQLGTCCILECGLLVFDLLTFLSRVAML